MKTVIEMARSVGATAYTNRHYPDRPTHTFNVDQLERFAELVRADERARMAEQPVQPEVDLRTRWPMKGWRENKAATTQPPAQPLTDDALADLWYKQSIDWMEFARAIEAAHGIKENT